MSRQRQTPTSACSYGSLVGESDEEMEFAPEDEDDKSFELSSGSSSESVSDSEEEEFNVSSDSESEAMPERPVPTTSPSLIIGAKKYRRRLYTRH